MEIYMSGPFVHVAVFGAHPLIQAVATAFMTTVTYLAVGYMMAVGATVGLATLKSKPQPEKTESNEVNPEALKDVRRETMYEHRPTFA